MQSTVAGSRDDTHSQIIDKQQFISQLDAFAVGLIEQRQAEAAALSADYTRMWDYLHKVYTAGGKRLRPYLAYMTFRAFGGSEQQRSAFLPVATAIEFLHIAMLIHDDIIDKDTIRHGQLNVSGLYQQYYDDLGSDDTAHHATSAAMLAGDVLISEAYRLVATANVEPAIKDTVIATMGQSVFEVIAGELLDTEAIYHDETVVDTEIIAKLKTASYSFVMPMAIGASMAGVKHETLEACQSIGTCLGISFQMIDDDLGVFGDEDRTGKSASNDITQGKRTMLLQQTVAMASAEDRDRLETMLRKVTLSADDVTSIRDIMQRSGARDAHLAQSQQYAEKGISQLRKLAGDSTDVRALVYFFEQLIDRDA